MKNLHTAAAAAFGAILAIFITGFVSVSGTPVRHLSLSQPVIATTQNSPVIVSLTSGTNFFVPSFATESLTSPTTASGFGVGNGVTGSGQFGDVIVFRLSVGTSSGNTGVITLPSTTNGWACICNDITTQSTTTAYTKQTASGTASCTIGNFTDVAAAGPWVNNDIILCLAMPF